MYYIPKITPRRKSIVYRHRHSLTKYALFFQTPIIPEPILPSASSSPTTQAIAVSLSPSPTFPSSSLPTETLHCKRQPLTAPADLTTRPCGPCAAMTVTSPRRDSATRQPLLFRGSFCWIEVGKGISVYTLQLHKYQPRAEARNKRRPHHHATVCT